MMSPYQVWKVTTWDVITGTEVLGYFEGYLDNIALKLGVDHKFLYFEPIEVQSNLSGPSAYEVIVSMKNIDTSCTVTENLRKLLQPRGDYYFELEPTTADSHSIKIIRKLTQKEKAKKELEDLLDTTSDEVKDRVRELIKEVYDTE